MPAAGAPPADDPRFATDDLRTRHEPVLAGLLRAWLADLPTEAALEVLQAAGVPASRILEAAQVFAGDYVRERGLLTDVVHPRLGSIAAMEQPVHFSDLPRGRQRVAPGLDQDREAVLARWLGEDGATANPEDA